MEIEEAMSNYIMAVFVEQAARIINDRSITFDGDKLKALQCMCEGWQAIEKRQASETDDVVTQESRCPMGIYSFLNRSAKKDEQITQLEKQVKGLTEQSTDLSERLAMAHEVEESRSETIKTQMQIITDLGRDVSAGIERIRELEANVAEYDVASDRFVQQIKDLHKEIEEVQGDCLVIASENSDLVDFVRKCVAGSGIRADRPSGAKLMEQARVLLKQYDNVSEQAQ